MDINVQFDVQITKLADPIRKAVSQGDKGHFSKFPCLLAMVYFMILYVSNLTTP